MWIGAVVNMSKQRGSVPPKPSLQKQTEDANRETHSACRGWNEVYFFFVKGEGHANRDKGKQKNERLHETSSSEERKVKPGKTIQRTQDS